MISKKETYYVNSITQEKLDRRQFLEFINREAAKCHTNWNDLNDTLKETYCNELHVRLLDLGTWKETLEEQSQDHVYCVETLKVYDEPCLAIQSNISLFSSRMDAEDFVRYQTVEGIMMVYHKSQEEAEESVKNENPKQVYLENILSDGPRISIKLTEKSIF